MPHFGRISTAMVTPFDSKGNIDFPKTTLLIEKLLLNGTESLVIGGTTGESPTLTKEEKVALFSHVVKVVNKRVPVIAGTGSNDTKVSIELTEKATEVGVDGVMVVAPYYNRPSQEGISQHIKSVAAATKLPLMIYNIPGRTGVNILPETIIELSKINNVVAVKEASGDLNAMSKIILNTSDDFELYAGDDSLTLPVLSIGGVGVVSVASHVLGNEMKLMIASFLSGDYQKAAKLHQELFPYMQSLFISSNPAPVKTVLQIKGFDVGTVRLPLVPVTLAERNFLQELWGFKK